MIFSLIFSFASSIYGWLVGDEGFPELGGTASSSPPVATPLRITIRKCFRRPDYSYDSWYKFILTQRSYKMSKTATKTMQKSTFQWDHIPNFICFSLSPFNFVFLHFGCHSLRLALLIFQNNFSDFSKHLIFKCLIPFEFQ